MEYMKKIWAVIAGLAFSAGAALAQTPSAFTTDAKAAVTQVQTDLSDVLPTLYLLGGLILAALLVWRLAKRVT